MAVTTATIAVNYFVAIESLTAQAVPAAPSEASISQFFPYAPFVLFGLLFIIALGIQLIRKVWDAKHLITSIAIALAVASIPAMLSFGDSGTRQVVKAGPEEVPREVMVRKSGDHSVAISWHTDVSRIGVVRFGKSPLKGGGRMLVADSQTPTLEHAIIVEDVSPGVSYEFEILSGSSWYDNNGQKITFTF